MTNNEKLMEIMQMLSDRFIAFDKFPRPENSAEWIYLKAKREQLLEDLKTVESIIEEK